LLVTLKVPLSFQAGIMSRLPRILRGAIFSRETGALGLAMTLLMASPVMAQGSVPKGSYATKAEAQAASLKLGCTGAHQQGSYWSPCKDAKTYSTLTKPQ
jgi:hypothetical protein